MRYFIRSFVLLILLFGCGQGTGGQGGTENPGVPSAASVSLSSPDELTEANLDNRTISIALSNQLFPGTSLIEDDFQLNHVPDGLSIAAVNYVDATHATISLAFDRSDFDVDFPDFSITVKADALDGGSDLTSNSLLIGCVNEDLVEDIVEEIIVGDYYVSTSGDDTGPGTAELPWRTIQKAADTILPGEIAVVKPGIYDEYVTISNSGDGEGERINIFSETRHTAKCLGFIIAADFVTIGGFDIEASTETWLGITINANSNIDIRNCFIHECPTGGIRIRSGSNVKVVNCILEHNGQWGISLNGANGLIEGNKILSTVQYHPKGNEPGLMGADADGMRIFGDGHVIRGNSIIGIGNPDDAGNVDPHSDCIQTWDGGVNRPIMTNTTIENNFFSVENSYGKGVLMETTGNPGHHIWIRNNIFEFRDIGVRVGTGGFHDVYIYNNVFKSELSNTSWGTSMHLSEVTDYAVVNNITADCNVEHRKIVDGTGLVDYNLAWNSDGSRIALNPSKQDNELFQVDPKFVSYTGNHGENNYHLQPDSPAIDIGLSVADVATDADGIPRPQDTGYDLGPFEYHTGGPFTAKVEIATWQGDKEAALTLQFDDSTPGQATLAIPALSNRNLVGTFYVNPGRESYIAHENVWEVTAPAYGQELANHSMNHIGAATDEEVLYEVGEPSRIIWDARGHEDFGSLIAFVRGGGTSWPEEWLQTVLAEYKNIPRQSNGGSHIYAHTVPKNSAANTIYEVVIPHILTHKCWGMYNFHGISAVDGGLDWGVGAMYFGEFEFFLDDLVTLSNSGQIWVGGYTQVYKYLREKATASVSVVYATTEEICLTLTSDMDPVLYDEPLTLITTVPDNWAECQATQAAVTERCTVLDGVAKIDAVPGKGNIVLREAE
ncbi:MAG: hypothetical protein HKM93_08265 [Desulfobacteraceae bacterium]|nr:hypothetical protein [Desulfobacteraceae bacterium]